MSISKEQVQHVAELARLTLTSDESEAFTDQLNQILQYAEKLQSLDTMGIEPTSHVIPLSNKMRDDEVEPSIMRQRALENAPEHEDGMFKVPPVFEG